MTRFTILFLWVLLNTGSQNPSLKTEFANYEKDRVSLNIPYYVYSYQVNFANIAPIDTLILFKKFYEKYDSIFKNFERNNLSIQDKINLDHVQYIISFQLRRFSLEMTFEKQRDSVSTKGLFGIRNHEE